MRIITSALALIVPFLINAQVSSVKLKVQVPPTANEKNVFVAGSFNGWKAGDSLYMMKKQDNSTYTIVLPVYKNVKYEYKYNMGGWSGVEIASNDSNIRNRSFMCINKKMKITDTVMKWATTKAAVKPNLSPQMVRINAMKDSVLKGLQPKLNQMQQLLKQYTINLLQEIPDAETDKRITAEVTKHFSDAYGRLNDLFHMIFRSMTPEQKQNILKTLSSSGAEKDFINTLGTAINEAVK